MHMYTGVDKRGNGRYTHGAAPRRTEAHTATHTHSRIEYALKAEYHICGETYDNGKKNYEKEEEI